MREDSFHPPLSSARVLVLRPEGQSEEIASLLREHGATPLVHPILRILPPTDPSPLREALLQLHSFDWVIFTSANGVDFTLRMLEELGKGTSALEKVRVCAIGPATAKRLCSRGIHPDLVPKEFRGEAVAEALLERMPNPQGQRVLIPRAERAREVLPSLLSENGVSVTVVAAYRTEGPNPQSSSRITQLIHNREVDIILLTSPSTAEQLIQILSHHHGQYPNPSTLLSHLIIASIGPVTTSAAIALGIRVDVTATTYTSQGLVDAIVNYVKECHITFPLPPTNTQQP
ncbi:MAG: uroporphyrinogen-III synthase [Sandaracinaceae bacterium]|nr:uroporphyrinogen-III synthase [Sandaracinaceae bacterium]MDW8246538.1 uroporphyrinogen-III synthase [Sandaracinaceae bacterium]